MSRKFALLLVFTTILLTDCAVHRKSVYVYPEGTSKTNENQIFEVCEKGRILYELHCSKCHGMFTRKKDGFPNFDARQINSYIAKALTRDPKNHAAAANMDQDQLNEIFMFLHFRKRLRPVIPAPTPPLGNQK